MKRKLFKYLSILILVLAFAIPVSVVLAGATYFQGIDNLPATTPDNDMDVYLCEGRDDALLPIEFNIDAGSQAPGANVPAQLVIYAYDVDEEAGEIDHVYFPDGTTEVGTLAGTNGTWSMSILDVKGAVDAGDNTVSITVAAGWCINVDWGQIVVDGGAQDGANITSLDASGNDWNNIQIATGVHITAAGDYGLDWNLLGPHPTITNNVDIAKDSFAAGADSDTTRNSSMSTGSEPAEGDVYTVQAILYDDDMHIQHIMTTTWTYSADSDGDGIHDILECPDPIAGCTDSDNDGIPDFQESNKSDSDGDGTPDQYDDDNDNEGNNDANEAGGDEWGYDADGDGIMDCFENDDYDSDGDGLNDETADKDSDADGIRDGCCIAIGCSPYVFNCEQFDDTDHDNIPDRLESNYFDTDGGTLADYADMDSDGDGEFDFEETAFADGDTDGVPDRLESDEHDSDGDGESDEADSNSDDDNAGNDGNEHTTDPNDGPGFYNDKDSDGIPDRYESNNHYSDTDCTPDDEDTDSDNDNISDHDEWYRDTDDDHVPDRYESNILDTDADGKVDYLDMDSDDDGIDDGDHNEDTTYHEGEGLFDADGDHVPDRVEPLWHYSDGADVISDSNNSGVGFDLIANGTYTGTYDGTYPVHATLAYTGTDQYDWDSDDDGDPDGYCNGGEGLDDSDGDGILDRFESNTRDSDGDDDVDELDLDSDDDGTPDGGPGERLDDEDDDLIPNRIESSSARSNGFSSKDPDEKNSNSDDDNVGNDDDSGERLDDDVDEDGIPDRYESDKHYSDANGKDAFVGSYPNGYDENDNDADNDGIPDGDTNDDGDDHGAEGMKDTDGDGVLDRLEHNERDTDGDGTPDYEDTDSDGDGTLDGVEGIGDADRDFIPDRLERNDKDTDGDGTNDWEDTDADGDGITDTVEILDANKISGTALPGDGNFLGDRDGDGWWNYVDYNPTGYFYNKASGEIIASGEISIEVEGPGVITITHYGNEGFYQFSTDGTAGIYTLTLKSGPPTGYAFGCQPNPIPLNPKKPEYPPYDPEDASGSFNGENQDTGFLMEPGCTNYHWTFHLGVDSDGNPTESDRIIINNNIGLVPTVGGHTEILYETSGFAEMLVEWGLWLLAMAVTGTVAVLSFRQRTV